MKPDTKLQILRRSTAPMKLVFAIIFIILTIGLYPLLWIFEKYQKWQETIEKEYKEKLHPDQFWWKRTKGYNL